MIDQSQLHKQREGAGELEMEALAEVLEKLHRTVISPEMNLSLIRRCKWALQLQLG